MKDQKKGPRFIVTRNPAMPRRQGVTLAPTMPEPVGVGERVNAPSTQADGIYVSQFRAPFTGRRTYYLVQDGAVRDWRYPHAFEMDAEVVTYLSELAEALPMARPALSVAPGGLLS